VTSSQESEWGAFLDLGGARSSVPTAIEYVNTSNLRGWIYVLIDLRSTVLYAEAHLAGATRASESGVDSVISSLPRDVTVILYCQDGTVSDRVAERLWRAGNSKVRSLVGGIDEWDRQFGNRFLVSSAG
jgi:rhodanese-related sulfurtransferase